MATLSGFCPFSFTDPDEKITKLKPELTPRTSYSWLNRFRGLDGSNSEIASSNLPASEDPIAFPDGRQYGGFIVECISTASYKIARATPPEFATLFPAPESACSLTKRRLDKNRYALASVAAVIRPAIDKVVLSFDAAPAIRMSARSK